MRSFFTSFLVVPIVFFSAGLLTTANAQDLSIAQHVVISEPVIDGTIIGQSDNVYHPTTEAYDKTMIGVATTTPAVEIVSSNAQAPGTYSVVSQGIVNVRVNTQNGAIQAGDVITSSATKGVGMKATKTGFILGVAQAGLSETTEGVIPVTLTIKFAFAADSPASEQIGTRLSDVIKLSSLSALEDPISTLRAVTAAIVMIVSIVVMLVTSGKVVRGSIDAVGRNPLAKGTIMVSMGANIVLSIVILAIGAGVAFLILNV